MSRWTQIVGVWRVDSLGSRHGDYNVLDILERILPKAPQITGSEDDAQVSIVPMRGSNVSHGNADGTWTEYQTQALVVMNGSLRDKTAGRTLKEVKAFERYLKKHVSIEMVSYEIED